MKIQQLSKFFKKNESGRSMVEMLGVLAVIGVLSIGGIYGYKMAMGKFFENDIRDLFARIYQAVQSSKMNPNTYLNCCSGNHNSTSVYAYCVGDDKWFDEQYDEICSYLSPDDCQNSWDYGGIKLMTAKDLGVWQYLTLRQNGKSAPDHKRFMIAFQWQDSASNNKDGNLVKKYGNEFLSNACESILTDITSNPVYREKLVGISKYRFFEYGEREATPENIKDVCKPRSGDGNNPFVSFSVYFENNDLIDCVEAE